MQKTTGITTGKLYPKSNAPEHFVKSVRNQGQILAKSKIEIFDIARYIGGYWNF